MDSIQENKDKAFEMYEKEIENSAENLPKYVKEGMDLFDESKSSRWLEVTSSLKTIYGSQIFKDLLEIQKVILAADDNNVIKDVQVCVDKQAHSGGSWSVMQSLIKEFCTNGEEILRNVV